MVSHGLRIKTPNSIPCDFNAVKGRDEVKSFHLKLETNRLICTNVSLEIIGDTVQTWNEFVVVLLDQPKV
jgi:hypothetical protein